MTKEIKHGEEALGNLPSTPVDSSKTAARLSTPISVTKKGSKKESKRTTPGPIPVGAAPKNAHVEGERWIKTTGKQILAKEKILRRKALKK
jgi:hypothetical protein